MLCDFERINEARVRCTRCATELPCNGPLSRCQARCRAGEGEHEDPSLLAMAWSAASAYSKWVAAGMPRRSPKEIEVIFAICQRCPTDQFAAASSSCRKCGCGCSSAESVLNKITLATEHCDDGHW